MFFEYKAKDLKGKTVEGKMEAADRRQIIEHLQKSGFMPVSVKEAREKSESLGEISLDFSRITQADVLRFTQQLSSLCNANLQLDRSLTIMGELTEKKKFRRIIHNIQQNVQGGSSFAEALARHPKIFSRLYVNMIKAGESGGVLELVISRLAGFMEEYHRIKNEVSSAMVYPVILTLVAGGAIAVLMTFVVPRFSVMFQDMGDALPLPTKILLGLSDSLINAWWMILLTVAAFGVGFHYYVKTGEGRLSWDRFKLKMPLFGNIILKQEVARFSRTLGTLLNSGIPILQGLAIVKELIGNRVISDTMINVYNGVKTGEGMSAALKEANVFPPMALHMIAIGEETGQLDSMLEKIATIYESELSVSIKRLLSIMEPLMIVFMALIIGFIVVAMLMAVFSVNEMAF
ncbi:MAG: type II secretion system inner membrane protein GspF [bacterium]